VFVPTPCHNVTDRFPELGLLSITVFLEIAGAELHWKSEVYRVKRNGERTDSCLITDISVQLSYQCPNCTDFSEKDKLIKSGFTT